jgi:hypothetical protein
VLRWLVQELGADVSQIYHGDTPLIVATEEDNLAALKCLVELGADVNQATQQGTAPLIVAADRGHLGVACYLVQVGARVGAANLSGDTALHVSALRGHIATMRYLLEEAGANMDDVNNAGETSWDLLIEHQIAVAEERAETDPLALTSLLRVMVLRGAPPPALVALLSPADIEMVQEGARLRARLPVYLAHRRAYLNSRCPRISLLPGVLRALIHGFEGPATTEELWATGLGTAE